MDRLLGFVFLFVVVVVCVVFWRADRRAEARHREQLRRAGESEFEIYERHRERPVKCICRTCKAWDAARSTPSGGATRG